MSKETSYSDEDLINLARQGDMEAYNLLLSRYNNKIQQIIHLHIQDRANVSDLAQEVLIKVYRYLHYFKEKSQFSTWLYRITQNTIKNHYRTTNLRLDLEAEYADSCYPGVELSPEYLIMNIEFGERLELILSTLSEELRLCYGMYILDGKSYEDIAKRMDCPIGTVRSRIFRARKLIMESMDQFVL
ncbi:sigma-70 family RNA polymerase sigma factor [Legionella sp. PC997]|uniref:sigma-70 family RNA polymerase sigma factor n=1 Tax=Legionella sp. PC997 TaxID=2755562 RepID=UPI0015F97357|nr:sigma-70 family RNA polymerase sigma factor [Legionella sp. PC997]QMT60207.1 RNA polymerase sigma factor [Legionella sp. PC997]